MTIDLNQECNAFEAIQFVSCVYTASCVPLQFVFRESFKDASSMFLVVTLLRRVKLLTLDDSLNILKCMHNIFVAFSKDSMKAGARLAPEDLLEVVTIVSEFLTNSVSKLRDRTGPIESDKDHLSSCEMYCLKILAQATSSLSSNEEFRSRFVAVGGLCALLLGQTMNKSKEARALRALVPDFPTRFLEDLSGHLGEGVMDVFGIESIWSRVYRSCKEELHLR